MIRVAPSVDVSNSSATIYTQTPKATGLTLIGVLLGEGQMARIGFVMEACQGGLH
jgi:hypothetical protein